MHDDVFQKTSYGTLTLLRDLRRLLQPYQLRFLGATILRATGDVARLYPAVAYATIVTLLTEGDATFEQIARLLFFAGLAHLTHALCRESAKFIGYQVAERVSLDAQLQTVRHLFSLDLSWHERENSGNKLKRMLHGGQGLDQILRMWITNLIEVGVNFVGITLIVATFDRRISLLLVGFAFLYYLLSFQVTRRAVLNERIVNAREEDFHGVSFEAVNNIRSVKVLGMAVPLLARLRSQAERVFQSIRTRILWYRIRESSLSIYGYAFQLSTMALIAWDIVHGRIGVGFLVLFVQYFGKIWENIEELSRVTQDFAVAKVGVSRMMDILRAPVGIDDESGKRAFPLDWEEIDVRGVSFGYALGQPVLNDISFSIRKGERIGIVGVSGAGKSTLFKLLLKEHESYEGEILIGNVPLRDIKRSSFFEASAVVLQETEVFNFPLRDNITLANPGEERNEALLAQSIEIAHVGDFLPKLPQGLQTFIGEKGIKLSGGEKQRVGIARAVFKEPQILFLDEATSHLDVESEEKIRDSLHHFFQQVTAIVIAHRLTTIREMDRILVLEGGQIIEAGTFDELYQRKGRFHELWEKQKF